MPCLFRPLSKPSFFCQGVKTWMETWLQPEAGAAEQKVRQFSQQRQELQLLRINEDNILGNGNKRTVSVPAGLGDLWEHVVLKKRNIWVKLLSPDVESTEWFAYSFWRKRNIQHTVYWEGCSLSILSWGQLTSIEAAQKIIIIVIAPGPALN